METTMLAAVAAVALVVGLAIGWLLGQRAAGAGEVERAELRERLNAATAELGHTTIRADELGCRIGEAERERGVAESALAALTARHDTALDAYKRESAALHDLGERLRSDHQAALTERTGRNDALSKKLDEVEADRSRLASELNGLRSEAEANSRSFEREIAALKEAREAMKAEFSEVGGKLLATTRDEFLKRADERFAESEKTSGEKLSSLIKPMHDRLATYEEAVAKVERERQDSYGELKGVIGEMRVGQQEVIAGAKSITTTLKGATKARGDWGEMQLENLLESCGLSDRTDFKREVNIKDDDDNHLRPDAIINIPGGRKLVVDVKNVFNTFRDANEAESVEVRDVLLAKHAREVRAHVQALAAKRYQDHVKGSADFVVMFVPGEHVLYAALTQDDRLLDEAFKQKVVLSSPLNFMSVALTVATVWRQADVQADAEEIGKLGRDLYDQLGVVAGKLSKLRNSLSSTNQNFDELITSFDGRLRVRGERFEKLGFRSSNKELAEALPIGHEPRRLAHFSDQTQAIK